METVGSALLRRSQSRRDLIAKQINASPDVTKSNLLIAEETQTAHPAGAFIRLGANFAWFSHRN
jgi:hypothetical protein